MNKRTILPLFLLVAVSASFIASPAAEAAWFKTFGKPKVVRLKKTQAFGSISGGSSVGNTMSARPAAMVGGSAVMNAGIATEVAPPTVDAKMMMPYPGDEGEYTQTPVNYRISASLPTIPGQSDVYRAIRAKADLSATKSILRNAGLPSAMVDGMTDLQSLNASWKTKDGMNWSADVVNGSISWWKDFAYPETQGEQKLDKDRAIKAAMDFVKAKGLSAYAVSPAELEDSPWIRPLLEGNTSSMPCPYVKAEPAVMDVATTSEVSAIAPSDRIMPPCFWYPQVINVVFPDIRDGKRVTDSWSGYPQQAMTISISLQTYEVTGGWVNVPSSVEASSYPTISAEAVIEQLQKGGRNPFYGWGKKGTSNEVTFNTFQTVLMRYDSWKDNRNETYFVPAVLAIGTVDRGDGQGLSEYRTVVPLIKAEFLQDVPNPIMYMKGIEAGVAAPAVAPTLIK